MIAPFFVWICPSLVLYIPEVREKETAVATFFPFDIFTEDMAIGVHDFSAVGDQLRIALSNTQPVVANSVLTDITEISYANLLGDPTSRDPDIATNTGQLPAGTWLYVLSGQAGDTSDLVLTASGGPVAAFRFVVHFNLDTVAKTDPLIQWYDHGSIVNLADGETFTIDYNPTAGFFQLASA